MCFLHPNNYTNIISAAYPRPGNPNPGWFAALNAISQPKLQCANLYPHKFLSCAAVANCCFVTGANTNLEHNTPTLAFTGTINRNITNSAVRSNNAQCTNYSNYGYNTHCAFSHKHNHSCFVQHLINH